MPYNFDTVSILIVEDNLPILELTKSILNTFGVGRIHTARDGKEGFKTFCQEIPDIIITDLIMTPINGLEFARHVRTDPHSPNPYVPIILVTAFSEKERIIEARDEGITEFLVKPFNARDLYRRISQVIESPRRFVKSSNFFGPDRRRKNAENYGGSPKRKTDIQQQDYESWKAGLSYDGKNKNKG